MLLPVTRVWPSDKEETTQLSKLTVSPKMRMRNTKGRQINKLRYWMKPIG